jgi:3-oxoacyl-[acyl-carrier protein] reductase
MSDRRSAIVTGATGGIPSAIVRTLAADGFDLTLVARTAGALESLSSSLPRGIDVQTVPADLTDADQIASLVAQHHDRFGRLDLLLNGVGAASPHKGAIMPIDELDRQWAINLRAPMILVQEALSDLRATAVEHGQARVILLGSLVGTHPVPYLSGYSAMKAGVRNFAEALNSAYARHAVYTTVIAPGAVDTPMSVDVPMEREQMISTDDIAELVRAITRFSPRSFPTEIPLLRRGSAIMSPI